MSTKTTFKRVALVAVAALGFGLLSVVPSSAATQSDTLAVSATGNATAVNVGVTASTTLTQTFLGLPGDTMTVTVSLVSGPTGNTVVPTLTVLPGSATNGLPTLVGTTVGQMMDTAAGSFALTTAAYTLALANPIAGTYVIKATPSNGVASAAVSPTNPTGQATSASAVTWTVTVSTVATTVGDSTSTSIINAAGVATGSADATITVAAGSSTAAVATIVVTPLAAGQATTGSTSISATITGPGTLTAGSSLTTTSGNLKSVTFDRLSVGNAYVHVYGDGTAGVSTITVKVGGVTVGTETVTFSGAAASAVATVADPVITSGSGAASFNAVTAIVKDANGNVVSGKTVYAVSGTTTVFASTSATTDSTGKATFALTGLAAGTSTVTVQDVAAGSTAGFTAAAVSVRAGTNIASSVTMTTDKASYVPGEQVTVTVVIKDAAGSIVADGTYAAFAAAVTSTIALTAGTLPTASLTTGSSTGTLTFKVNAPQTTGDFTLSALGGAGLAAAQAGLAISATATVTPSAAAVAASDAVAAAADAAAEATDAANAATDAANAAAEAADAATAAAQDAADAVAALSTQVADLIAGLTAQISAQKAAITALTNLVIKIQKKVKA